VEQVVGFLEFGDGDVGIDRGGLEVGVSHHGLDVVNITAILSRLACSQAAIRSRTVLGSIDIVRKMVQLGWIKAYGKRQLFDAEEVRLAWLKYLQEADQVGI